MSMLFGGSPAGVGRTMGPLNQNGNRTGQLARQGYAPFSNPFFDLASTYTPPTIKGLFAYCRHFHLSHGVINAIITKASEYPVTDLILSSKDASVKERWEELMLGGLNYRVHQLEVNLDYFVYGNAFISPSLPFTKMLRCGACNVDSNAVTTRANWRYNSRGFWLSCPKCGQSDFAKARDDYYPRLSDISLTRWNPELISTFYNEATGRCDYTLDFSVEFKNGITLGRKDLVATTPQVILEAIKAQKTLVFDSNAVFHMRRPGLSNMAKWGIPLMMPVLKDAFFMQIMKKSQESILLSHLVPQVFLFPQPATSGADPFCVTPETLIEVPGGVRPACEVQAGDFLRSHTGAWRRVEAVVRRPVPKDEKVYKVTPYTLAAFPFTVSEEHPVLAAKNPQRRSGNRFDASFVPTCEFIEVKALAPGDFVAYPLKRAVREEVTIDLAPFAPDRTATEDWIYSRYPAQGAEIYEWIEEHGMPSFKRGPGGERTAFLETQGWDLKQYSAVQASLSAGHSAQRMPRFITLDAHWMRVLGYFLAEGHTAEFCFGFAFHEDETAFIDELCESLEAIGYPGKRYAAERNGVINVVVHDSMLAEILQNMCGRYAASKRIPASVSEAPDELLHELLRCLFNGDGTILIADTKGTVRVALKTTSPHLALEARRLLLCLGYVGGIVKGTPREGEIAKAVYYSVAYNGTEGVRLAERFGWTVPPCSVTRSEKNAFVRDGYVYMRIRVVEEVDAPEVIGYQMAVDRTFCVAGVATHNTTVSLANWRDHIRSELARQRQDSSYYAILPFPLGHQTIGENGKSLLLMPEIQTMAEHICIGMGFPVDLIFGNGTYAGSSVNMRMLENFYLSNMHGHKRLVSWVIKHLGSFLNWPTPDSRFKAFRMADDLQRSALLLQMQQGKVISESTLLSQVDLKVEDETKLRVQEMSLKAEAARKEAEYQAQVQGETQVTLAKYQAQAQGAMQSAMAHDAISRKSPFESLFTSPTTGATGVTLDAVAAALADAVRVMPPERKAAYMRQLRSESPEMEQLVQQQQGVGLPAMPDDGSAGQGPQQVAQGGDQGAQQAIPGSPAQPQVDMTAQPEVLPPRRPGGV
jgi:hypothetical protein